MGHIGRDPETFEWVVPRLPYVVAVKLTGNWIRSLSRPCFTVLGIGPRSSSEAGLPVGFPYSFFVFGQGSQS